MFGSRELLLIVAVASGWGLPLGLPPLPPDPVVQRAAPEECLLFLQWSGIATPSADSKNRTEQLLAHEEVQTFITDLGTQLTGAFAQAAKGKPETTVLAGNLPGLVKTILSHPTAIYISEMTSTPQGPNVRGGMVVNLGGDASQAAAAIEKLEQALKDKLKDQGKIEDITVAGLKLKRLSAPGGGPVVTWGLRKSFLIVTVGVDEPEALIKRLATRGKAPPWLLAIQKKLPVERLSSVAYVNVAAALKAAELPPQAKGPLEAMGLSQITSFTSVSVLTATGAMSRSLLAIDGDARGLMSLLSGERVTLDDLKIVPHDARMAWALRVEAADAYRQAELIGQGTYVWTQIQEAVGGAERMFGLRVKEDLLEPLGDSWTAFATSAPGGAGGFAATCTLEDRAKLVENEKRVVQGLRDAFAKQPGGGGSVEQTMIGPLQVHTLKFRPGIPMAPCWAITEDHLVITANLAVMRALLERGPGAKSLADVKAVQKMVGDKAPFYVSYQDTATLLTETYASMNQYAPLLTGGLARLGIAFQLPKLPALEKIKPHVTPTITVTRNIPSGILSERYYSFPVRVDASTFAPLAAALLLPGIGPPRQAAANNLSMNNMKQIALAMHNWNSANKQHFPAPAIYDKQGKPLLSWRVQILPYLDEMALYKEFHLDEPWDSAHNKPLIARMPALYLSPGPGQVATSGKTRYRVPSGPMGMFPGKGLSLREITDGTSNTIMLVEVAAPGAVEWTKPDDLEVDNKDPLAGLTGNPTGQFLVAFADGSVRPIRETVDTTTMIRLFMPQDKTPVDHTKL